MKRTLLLTFFLFCGLAMFAQSEGQLALNTPAKVQVKVFPNPFTNYLKIDDAAQAVKQIVVYNLLGKKMKTFPVYSTGESYPVEQLPRGFYLVQLQGINNKIIKTQRLKKQ